MTNKFWIRHGFPGVNMDTLSMRLSLPVEKSLKTKEIICIHFQSIQEPVRALAGDVAVVGELAPLAVPVEGDRGDVVEYVGTGQAAGSLV